MWENWKPHNAITTLMPAFTGGRMERAPRENVLIINPFIKPMIPNKGGKQKERLKTQQTERICKGTSFEDLHKEE